MEQYTLDFSALSSDYTRAELALLSPEDIYARADETLLYLRNQQPPHSTFVRCTPVSQVR
jgi:hypothetical protein